MKPYLLALLCFFLLQITSVAQPIRSLKLKGSTSFSAIQFSSDLKHVAAVNSRDEIHYFDLKTGKLERTFKILNYQPDALTVSRDGQLIASAGHGGVKVWDTRTGRLLHDLHNGMDMFSIVVISPDKRTIAASATEDPICFWDLHSGKLKADRNPVFTSALNFAPDGKTYLAASFGGMQDGKREMNIADVATGKVLSPIRYSDEINYALFSSDGKTVVTGGGGYISEKGVDSDFAQVCLWDVKTAKLQRVIKWKGKQVWGIALKPDNSEIVTGSDEVIRIWNAKDGSLKRVLKGHTSNVRDVAFSPDGATLATGSSDGMIKFWRVGKN